MSNEPQVRGLTFLNSQSTFTFMQGDAGWQRAVELMPRFLREQFRQGEILAGRWYPISVYRAFHQALRGAAPDVPELHRRLGRLSAEREIRGGLHTRLLAYLVSPKMLLSMSGNVFGAYYDTGRLDIVQHEPGYVRSRLSGCVGWDRHLFQVVLGFSEGLLRMAGAKDLVARVLSGGGDNDDYAESEGRWTP